MSNDIRNRLRARIDGKPTYSTLGHADLGRGVGVIPGLAKMTPALRQLRRSELGRLTDQTMSEVESALLAQEAVTGTKDMVRRIIGTWDGMAYVRNMRTIPVSIGAAEAIVLDRAETDSPRVFFLCVVTHPTQTLFLAFDRNVTVTNGLPLAPLRGSLLLDSRVAQGEVHLIASGAATTGIMLVGDLSPGVLVPPVD